MGFSAKLLDFYLGLEMFVLFKCPAIKQNHNNNFSVELQVQNTGTIFCQILLCALDIHHLLKSVILVNKRQF